LTIGCDEPIFDVHGGKDGPLEAAIHDHDHDRAPDPQEQINGLEQHTLTSVGIDIGSSTSQVVPSRLTLRRRGSDLSTRSAPTASASARSSCTAGRTTGGRCSRGRG
jgi:hypothetical protein